MSKIDINNLLDAKVNISAYKSVEEEELALSYLGLDTIPNRINNPFFSDKYSSIDDPVEQIVDLCLDVENIYFICKYIFNLEVPPFQLATLETMWKHRLPLLIASRGASKSFLLGLYALLRMVLLPGTKVVAVGAAFRQSKQIFEYMCDIWSNAPVLRDIAGDPKYSGPKTSVDRCQFNIGSSRTYIIPLGSGEKIRGLRANCVLADEIASVNEEIFNIVIQGFAVVSQSPVERIKEEAIVSMLKEKGLWTPEMDMLKKKIAQGNQIICSGTAFYQFNHFYKTFRTWHKIISSKGDLNKIKDIFDGNVFSEEDFNHKDYAIIRIPYTALPRGWQDSAIISQAKARMSQSQFLMEIGCVFIGDSDGFYKRSILESCTTNKPITVSSGEKIQFSAKKYGETGKSYVISVDPAADVDNAAIVVLELNNDHRKIVHCWSTNKKKYTSYKLSCRNRGIIIGDDYYKYIAKKIRELMRTFNTEVIMMDKHGGGGAITEALHDTATYEKNELPIYEEIDLEEIKPTDMDHGLHILRLVVPTNEFNSDANHGMLKDFQDKVLLFPIFDTVEIEKSIIIDQQNEEVSEFDSYEDLVMEIEELKNEICSVVPNQSMTGKETFDTPKIKGQQDKKGRLRKDRFSALLYGNYYARMKDINKIIKIEYKSVGSSTKVKMQGNRNSGALYSGPGLLKMNNANGSRNWVNYGAGAHIKH